MKRLLQLALVALCTLASVNLLVSCSPKGNPTNQDIGSAGPNGGNQTGQNIPAANGTSTSGGGTGVDGKAFLSYAVDPTQLPAYTQDLKKVFDNIKSDHPENNRYELFFKTKTWYIAPVDLEKLNKDILGISFIKSETQQIARQSLTEVWIDKRIYDKMNLRDQSELLLHEYIMNLYFLKFLPMSEMCRFSVALNDNKSNDDCGGNSKLLDKVMPPEQTHPLTDKDNENIRFVESWLLQNATAKVIQQESFIRILAFKEFDKRIFKPDMNSKGLDELKISRKEFYQVIKGEQLSGNMPDVCNLVDKGISKSCKVEINETSLQIMESQFPGYKLRVTAENEPPINISILIGPDEVHLSASQNEDASITYTYGLLDWRNKIKIGDRLYSGFLLFKKESPAAQAGLVLESILLKPGVVVSIDKKREPVCLLRAPKTESFLDEAIAIRRQNAVPGLIELLYSATPPFAACSQQNVVD